MSDPHKELCLECGKIERRDASAEFMVCSQTPLRATDAGLDFTGVPHRPVRSTIGATFRVP